MAEAELVSALVQLGGESITIGILIWVLFDERRERRNYSRFVMSMVARLMNAEKEETE